MNNFEKRKVIGLQNNNGSLEDDYVIDDTAFALKLMKVYTLLQDVLIVAFAIL